MIYFFAYGILGWFMQSLYLSLRRGAPVNAGVLFLPLCPVFGFCMWFLLIFVYPHGLMPPLLFLACFAVVSLAEYFTGLAFELIFEIRLWDYRGYEYSINGRISPLWSIFWGAAAALVLVFAQPAAEGLLAARQIPPWAFVMAMLIILLDMGISVKTIFRLKNRLADMTRLRRSFNEYLHHSNVYETPRKLLEFADMQYVDDAITAIHEMDRKIVAYAGVPEEELAARMSLVKIRYDKLRKPSFLERRLLAAFPIMRINEEAESLGDLLGVLYNPEYGGLIP